MADDKKKSYVKIATPIGTGNYLYLNSPDTKFSKNPDGEYKGNLVFNKDAKGVPEMLAKLDKGADDAFAAAIANNDGKTVKVVKGKKKELVRNPPYTIVCDDEGNETDQVVLKAKMAASYKKKSTGETIVMVPEYFDAKGKKIVGAPPKMWSGSLLAFSGVLVDYDSEFGIGVSFRLNAVQIIKAAEGQGGSAEAHGFGSHEGFEATDEDLPAKEAGFTDQSDAEEAEDDVDF